MRCLYKKQIPFLDFIRFFATIQIVIFHYVSDIKLSNEWVLLWGREGVALFFMISGAGLVNKYYYQISIKEFYKKRLLSIFIPFYVAWIAVFMWRFYWNSFTTRLATVPLKNAIFTIIGFDGLASRYGIDTFYQIGEWYLGVMILIYIFFPIWLYFFRKRPFVVVVVLTLMRIYLFYNNLLYPLSTCFNPITAYSNFSIGAYSILLFSKKDYSDEKNNFIFGLVMLIIGFALGHYFRMIDWAEIFAGIGLFYICIFISKYFSICNKQISFICSISYEIFLLHHVIIYAMSPIINLNYTLEHMLYGFALVLISTVVAAYILKSCVNVINSALKRS